MRNNCCSWTLLKRSYLDVSVLYFVICQMSDEQMQHRIRIIDIKAPSVNKLTALIYTLDIIRKKLYHFFFLLFQSEIYVWKPNEIYVWISKRPIELTDLNFDSSENTFKFMNVIVVLYVA